VGSFRAGGLLVLLMLAACTTYDASLIASYNPAIAAGGGGMDAGGTGGLAVVAGGAPGAAGVNDDAGSAGMGEGATDAGAGTGSVAGVAGTSGAAGTGGTTATAGNGGSAGGAGAVAGGGSGGSSPYELIDDFETLSATILPLSGRNGPWYMFNDGTTGGVQNDIVSAIALFPTADARPGSTAGLHLTAKGFTGFGAGVGADFVNKAAKKQPYDVSAYSGIRFYAKIATGTQPTLKLLIPTTYSDPDGLKCSGTGASQCYDHLSASVTGLKTIWAVYQVNFAALGQQGIGLPQASLDPKSVYSMQFTLATKPTLPADIWFDDISFVKK
jgi:hypothetical protein